MKKLKKQKVIFCNVSAPQLPDGFVKTAQDIYIRFHGKKEWYRYDYSKKELQSYANQIKKLKAKNIWVYFNNDFQACAVKNAIELKKILS